MSAQAYVQAAVLTWAASQGAARAGLGQASVVPRVWFNDANTSSWFFVPGILMLVLTISGVFLTAMVMAREWERGTFESLFVTPVRIFEVILAKAALACDNAMTHTVRTSSPVLMCLVIPLMMGYPRIFSVCRRIVSSSLFCRIGFSMKSFTPRS